MPEVSASCVLIVDADAQLRTLLSAHFEKAGFHTIHAGDGTEALVRLRDALPEVIVSDLQMPRMSGLGFIGIVRRRFPTIPVVALSGSIPLEFSEGIKPDCWFEKSMLGFPELMQTVRYLAQHVPNQIDRPQVISLPIRARRASDGYGFLTCPRCLRRFRVTNPLGNMAEERSAVCTNCDAPVPFLIESSEPE
jgi:CheY-like chemotaxis protein